MKLRYAPRVDPPPSAARRWERGSIEHRRRLFRVGQSVARLAYGILALAACNRSAPAPASATAAALMIQDADGKDIPLVRPARRIISLFPSATDVLVALGTNDRLLARTRFDTDSSLGALPLVGDAAKPSLETILALEPDVVIAWEGINDDYLRGRLAASGIPTVSLQMLDTAGIFRGIATLGQVTGRDSAATALNARLRTELAEIRRSVEQVSRPRVFYVAWNDPPMTAGPNTFTGQLIEIAGGRTIFPELKLEWPVISLEELLRRQPDILILPVGDLRNISNEALGRLPGWRDLAAVRQQRILRLPVELVNRPGPRIAEAARALRDGLHPESARLELLQ